MKKFDVVVIGSGPGGYVAAIRAAQKGFKVACIEKEKTLGGTCLNVGCIPSKALLHSTEYYHRIVATGKEHGIEGQLSINLPQMMLRKQNIVTGLTQGISHLFKKNKVTHLSGEATFLSSQKVQVGEEQVEAKFFILATGSESIPLPFLPFDETHVLSSTGALSLKQIPKKLLIVGAGVIGLELGSVYRRLGSQIEVIELLDRVVPGLDSEISRQIEQILSDQGFSFKLKRKVLAGKVLEGNVHLTLDQDETICGDAVLVAIGRRPYFKNLGLEKVGIEQDKQGRVKIDRNFRTTSSNIFAIGDLIDGPMLAHKASEEGIAVVDLIAGEEAEINYLAVPNVMYTWPEVACVGMTQEEASQAGFDLLIGKMPFKAVPRARCSSDTDGVVKILGEKTTGRVIGLHIIGPNASELIHEGSLAISQRLTLSQIAYASHAHPTNSEAIKEAALIALGHPLNI